MKSIFQRSTSLGSHKRSESPDASRPMQWGLQWRSSVWFVTLVVGIGIATDLLVYAIIVPVLPFQLESLGYDGVSGLVGWLLFAYSAGLVVSTPPIAHFSERYHLRRVPMICGLAALIGAQIMLMEAPRYWVMVLARIIQGISSSVVWVVGLALLCDTVPEKYVGRQLGFAMSGFSIGFLVGPPVSGALYDKFGFRGPFIFGTIVTLVDLIGRLLVIERKTALLYGFDPAAIVEDDVDASQLERVDQPGTDEAQLSLGTEITKHTAVPIDVEPRKSTDCVKSVHAKSVHAAQDVDTSPPVRTRDVVIKPRISLLTVLARMIKSPRACAVFVCTLSYGIIVTSQEPDLPLHLQDVWNLDPSKVGLVYIAAVVPGLFSTPLAGWLADRNGTAWITALCMILTVPWLVTLTLQKSLVLFIVAYGIMNFFLSSSLSPIMGELAAAARSLEGVGYAHVYGAFNVAYGVGSALGPLIGGQIYDHTPHGWTAICLLGVGMLAVCVTIVLTCFDETPILTTLWRRHKRRDAPLEGEKTSG